jgi:murein DD-endopeptidase MepM/ murein hydrolase activator NlpD
VGDILEHGRPRGALLRWDATTELGEAPPLSVDGHAAVDRRRVSVQWFSGTILTGLCGAALMGGAVFAALDGETTFASVPERLETALRGSLNGFGERIVAAIRKADRLPAPAETNTTRNVIRVTTTTRVGDREVVRVRPYVRVVSNLSLTVSELSANIPPFNAQKMLGDVGAPAPADEAAAAEPDAEVSFVTRDLASALPRVRIAANVPAEDVVAAVRAIGFTGGDATHYTVPGLPGDTRLAYAATGDNNSLDLYAGFESRVVPENITMLPKTASQAGTAANEKLVPVKKGDTIGSILRDLGAAPAEIKSIAGVLGPLGKDGALKEGEKVRVLISASTGRPQPVRVVIMNDTAVEAVVALSDMGKYVSVDVQSAEAPTATADNNNGDDEDDDGSGVRLYQSIYETALRSQIPRSVVDDMIRVYSYDVDFQRKTQAGDAFEVLYVSDDENGGSDSKGGDVLYAALTLGGEVKKYYRFQTNDGQVDYYDETGKSARKFLVRKPVANAIMRSGFGARNHPILGYTKMHTGVDWAAPMGTPIFAAGSGTLEKVGWESGYGKYIRIKHNNGYETAYGHMTAYAKGMQAGARVRQGQVIGFIGSTGLSTGAHCHFEIMVNGRFVDPMRVKLPRGRSLEGTVLASFDKERERLDGIMTQRSSAPRVAGR